MFSHEMCTFPPQLFATEELLLAADTTSELAKSFPSLEDPASCNRDDMKYVIDGGMLIHRITWKVGSSFTDIRASYVSFLSKYPQCTVVFDGYRNSTKDMAHKVRSKNLSCSNITVESSTCLTVKKAQLNIRGKLTESIIQTFYSHESTKEEIKSAGEKIFFLLLNLSPSDGNLDASRLRLFNAKVIKGCAAIDSTSLPPTSAAAYEHSLRVYHQVQAWLVQDLDPTGWGFKIKEGCHVPVTSQLPAAPDEILEIIHCSCKTGCKQHQCSCVRHGIMCGPGCVNCTDNCENKANSDD